MIAYIVLPFRFYDMAISSGCCASRYRFLDVNHFIYWPFSDYQRSARALPAIASCLLLSNRVPNSRHVLRIDPEISALRESEGFLS